MTLGKDMSTHRMIMPPIQKCPEEVLLMIFDAVTEHNSILATHLLTVCRRWYDIVVRAPILWNHIFVKLGGKSAISTAPDMVTQHITTCLRRSASSPLHIRLDLEDLEEEERETFCHPPGALEAISVLVGDRSENMKRWETAEIIFPAHYGDTEEEGWYEDEYSMDEPIWQFLCGPVPNLAKLSVKNAHFFKGELPEERFISFLGMGSLTELKINRHPLHWDFLGLNFESVRVLQLDADTRSHQQMLDISRFTHLQHLIIYFTREFEDAPSTPATVHLPSLQTLSLQHYSEFQISRSTIWNVPVLQMLTISGYLDALALVEFPSVEAFHVCWETYAWFQTNHAREHLRRLISQYTKTRKLTIPDIITELSGWESLADELLGQPGSRLEEIEFLEEEEEEEEE